MSLYKHILLQNHHHNQNKKHFHQPQNCFMLFGSLTPYLNPQTQATTNLFSILIVWPSQECEINGIRQYVDLSIWIPSQKGTHRGLLDGQCTSPSTEYNYME